MTQLNTAKVRWVSRVPETSTAAQAIVQERLATPDMWQHSLDGTRHWDAAPLPIGGATDIPTFSGQRVTRRPYRAADGWHITTDANGSYNTTRKGAPEAFAQGSSGCVVHPVRLAV